MTDVSKTKLEMTPVLKLTLIWQRDPSYPAIYKNAGGWKYLYDRSTGLVFKYKQPHPEAADPLVVGKDYYFFAGALELARRDKKGRQLVAMVREERSGSRQASRVIWEVLNGPVPDGYDVDHVNQDPSDDRLQNLHLVRRSMPEKNRSQFNLKRREKEGYPGSANIMYKGKVLYIPKYRRRPRKEQFLLWSTIRRLLGKSVEDSEQLQAYVTAARSGAMPADLNKIEFEAAAIVANFLKKHPDV